MIRRAGLPWLIANAAGFQAGWLICVLFGNVWAAVTVAVASAVHFALTPQRQLDLVSAGWALALGLVHDNLLGFAGLLEFGSPIAPVWLASLWWLLGLTLYHSLHFIHSRPWLASGAGAVSACFAYFGGVSLSQAQWGAPIPVVLGVIFALWLAVLPLHRWLVSHSGGVRDAGL